MTQTFTGTTHFFTLRLADPQSNLLIAHIPDLRRATRHMLDHHPCRIDAISILPNVLHMLLTLPQGDRDYPNRIGILKSRFSRAQPMPTNRSLPQIKRGEKGIWQRRYWEHTIRDTADYARHRDLIYLAPVHAGLCKAPRDWPHSSIHRDLKHGLPPPPQAAKAAVPSPRTLQEQVLMLN